MQIFTDGLRGPASDITIRELWADNLTRNTELIAQTIKVVAICFAVCFVAWLVARAFSPRSGRLGRIVNLWLATKERELTINAGKSPFPVDKKPNQP